MTVEIVTKYGLNTYSAKCEELRLKATCTAGDEWAARAMATKVINHMVKFRGMKNPYIDELVMVRKSQDYTQPVTWRLTLKEGGSK